MDEQKQLRLEVSWYDGQLIQVQVTASNGRYRGATQVYTTEEELSEFADKLAGFPKKVTDIIEFEFGGSGDDSFAGFRFYCIDGAGHTVVRVRVREKITHSLSRPEEVNESSFELRFDAGLIDQFQPAITRMAKTRDGSASLF